MNTSLLIQPVLNCHHGEKKRVQATTQTAATSSCFTFQGFSLSLSGQVAKPHAQTPAPGEGPQPPTSASAAGQNPAPPGMGCQSTEGQKAGIKQQEPCENTLPNTGTQLCTEAVIPDKELLTCRPAPGCSSPWLGHSLCTGNTAMSCTGHTDPSLHESILIHQASNSAGFSKQRTMTRL